MSGFFDFSEPGEKYWWCRASLNDLIVRSTYQDWRAEFEGSDAGRRVLRMLETTLRPRNPALYPRFLEETLFACWCARRYSGYPHKPNTLQRQASRGEYEVADSLLAVLDSLLTLLEKRPAAVELLDACLLSEDGYHAPSATGSRERIAECKNKLLARRDRAKRITESGRGTVACVAYGRSVKGPNLPADEAAFGLAYELALRNRCFTRKSDSDPLDPGDGRMPSDGEPHYTLVAQLISVVLHDGSIRSKEAEHTAARQLGGQLRKFRHDHPDARWVGWRVRMPQ